jgi:hypothetical protein
MNAKRLATAALGMVCGCWALSASLCMAGNAAESARPILDKLLRAVEANDYASFVADGTDAVKAGLTKPMLEGVSAQLAPRMTKGYETSYLGELKQQGCQVHLWKLAYKDGGDDTLAKLVIQDGKVAGFWLQ